MILKSIKLENFLSHDDTEIEFAEDGITAIIGENGSGKSSIIEGIIFALYGISNKGNNKDLIKWGRKKTKVELIFKKRNELYKIERELELSKKGNINSQYSIYKFEKGNYVLYYTKEINKKVVEVTRISKKTFFNSILVKQGEIEGLIKEKPSEREKIIEEILNIDKYKEIREEFKNQRNELKNKLDNLNLQISNTSLNDLEKDITTKLEEKDKTEHSIKKIENELKNIQIKIENLDHKLKERLNIESRIADINRFNSVLEKDIEMLKQELIEIEKDEKILDELKEKVSKLEKLEKQKDEINNLINLINKKESIEKELKDVEEKIKTIESFKEIAEKYEEERKKVEDIVNKLKEISKYKGNIEQLKRQQIDIIENIKKERLNYNKIVEKLKTYNKKFQTLELNPLMIKEFKNQNDLKIKKLENDIKELNEKLGAIKQEGKSLKENKEEISKLSGKCPVCLRPIEEHEKEKIYKELEEKILEKREEFKKVKSETEAIEEELKKQKEIKELLQEIDKIYEEIKKEEKKLEEVNAKIKINENKIKSEESLEKEKEEIDRFLKENQDKMGIYKKYISENPYKKQKELLIQLENINKEILSINIQNKNLETLELLKKQISEEIEILKPQRDKYFQIQQKISSKNKKLQEKEEKENEFRKNKEEIQNLEEKLKDIDRDIIETELKNLKTEKENLESQKLTLIEQKGKLDAEIKNLQEKIKEVKKVETEIQEIERKLEKYNTAINAIDKYIFILKQKALYNIPKLTEETFLRFGFNDFINLRFTEDFDIVFDAGVVSYENIDVKVSALSGGQRIALGLALRFAIARLLNEKSDFLILDEPTIHLDKNRISELVNILGILKEEGFIKQLIVITHDEEIEERADKIYKVSKGKAELLN